MDRVSRFVGRHVRRVPGRPIADQPNHDKPLVGRAACVDRRLTGGVRPAIIRYPATGSMQRIERTDDGGGSTRTQQERG